jgi:Bacterial Ig-like domain (group 2)
MRCRRFFGVLLLFGVAMSITSCINSGSLTEIQVSPATLTATAGTTIQFKAVGFYTHPNHVPITKDITNEVNWSSASSQMVTISNTGFATVTGKSIGNTLIYASAMGFHGYLDGYANVTVTQSGAGGDITSLSIVPAAQTASTINQQVQFTAIGTTANGTSVNVTSQSTWSSSIPAVASVNSSTGLATALSAGTTKITAVYTNPDGTVATGNGNLTVSLTP